MKKTFTLLTLGLLLLGTSAFADDPPANDMKMSGEHMMSNDQTMMQNDAYPIDYCIVSGEKLGGMGDPVKFDYEGREIEFCCGNCIATFKKDPEKYLNKLDAAIIEKQSATYPLSTCVVSGEKLGSDMGKPVDMVYNNELVRFCCNGCVKDFKKDPDKYMKKIHEARQEQMMNGEHHDDHEGHTD